MSVNSLLRLEENGDIDELGGRHPQAWVRANGLLGHHDGKELKWYRESEELKQMRNSRELGWRRMCPRMPCSGESQLLQIGKENILKIQSRGGVLMGLLENKHRVWILVKWKKESRVLKAEEAWEHLKLTSGTEEEVGVKKDPMYFALESGVRGGPSASGSQKGESHSE